MSAMGRKQTVRFRAGSTRSRLSAFDPKRILVESRQPGLVLVAIGLALVGMSLVVADPEWERYGLGAALFPLFVGAALIARHLWLGRQLEREIAGNT